MVYRTKKKYNSRKIKNKTKRNKTKRNKTKRNKTKRKTVKLGGRPPSIFKPEKPTKPRVVWDNEKEKSKRGGTDMSGTDLYIHPKPTIGQRFSGNLLRFTPSTWDKFGERVTNKFNNINYDNSTHMKKEYVNTEITPECDAKTPKTCRCTSKEGRVQDLLNMSENGGVCTKCGEQCPRTQKILENYKRLENLDLESLPVTRIGISSRSRFPAYYKGYMTPSRINSLIQTKVSLLLIRINTSLET